MPLSINTPRPEMPIDVGGELIVSVPDENSNVTYSIRVYPAANNGELKITGQPMKFYFCPDRVFLANNPDGNYKFQLLTYQGEFSENSNAGVAANASLAGGVCTFTTTMRIPEQIIAVMQQKLKEKIKNESRFGFHRLFGLGDNAPEPSLLPVTIIDSEIVMHNIDLSIVTPETAKDALGPESFVFNAQGNGKGATSYGGENAFTVTMGMVEAAFLQGAMLDGGKTPLTVQYAYKYKIAASAYKIEIATDWKSVFDHCSSQFSAETIFTAIDVQRVFEDMQKNAVIQVRIHFDEEFMDKDDQKFMRDHKEEILKKFIDMGMKTVFDAQPPKVDPAQAKEKKTRIGLGFGPFSIDFDFGMSFSMKRVHQEIEAHTTFEETEDRTVIRANQASGNFTEIREVVSKTPEKLELYFSKIFLADAFKIVYVAAHSNANWRTPDNPNGDPLNSLSVQVGYPITANKAKVTKAAARFIDPNTGVLSEHETDASWTFNTKDRIYIFRFDLDDSIPDDDEQKIEVIRTVSFQEDPNVVTNIVTLENVTDDHKVEVRAESAGKFGVTMEMENSEVLVSTPRIKVTVTCQVDGMQDQLFVFDRNNALTRQTWNIWYAEPEDIRPMKYRVDVALSGRTIFERTLRWGTPDWLDYKLDTANGMLSVPFPDMPEDMIAQAEKYLTPVAQPAAPTPQRGTA
ncbi:MAG: hypothetical protein V4714_11405 [Bacteroidota bacterium]